MAQNPLLLVDDESSRQAGLCLEYIYIHPFISIAIQKQLQLKRHFKLNSGRLGLEMSVWYKNIVQTWVLLTACVCFFSTLGV